MADSPKIPTRADIGNWFRTPGMNGTLWTPDRARGAVLILSCVGRKGSCTKVAAVPIQYLDGLETLQRALQSGGFRLQSAEATLPGGKRPALLLLCADCFDGIQRHGIVQEPSPVILTDK